MRPRRHDRKPEEPENTDVGQIRVRDDVTDEGEVIGQQGVRTMAKFRGLKSASEQMNTVATWSNTMVARCQNSPRECEARVFALDRFV